MNRSKNYESHRVKRRISEIISHRLKWRNLKSLLKFYNKILCKISNFLTIHLWKSNFQFQSVKVLKTLWDFISFPTKFDSSQSFFEKISTFNEIQLFLSSKTYKLMSKLIKFSSPVKLLSINNFWLNFWRSHYVQQKLINKILELL